MWLLLQKDWVTKEHKKITAKKFPNQYDWNIKQFDNLTSEDYINYLDTDAGFWSWLLEHMYGINGSIDGIHLCHTNRIDDEFSDLIKPYNKEQAIKAREFFRSEQHIHAMKGYNSILGKIVSYPRKIDYRSHYNNSLAELVYQKDKKYIDQFGFKF